MPRKQDIPLPADYIHDVSTHLTRKKFEEAFRKQLPEETSRLTPSQMDRLFEITCNFRKEYSGIAAIRRNRVVSDLERCETVIAEARASLIKFIKQFRSSKYRERPHSAATAKIVRSGAAQLSRQLAEELTGEWGRERDRQARWASKLSLKDLESKFVRDFESCLLRYLRPLGLTPKKQNEYVNAVIAGVLALNDPRRKTDIKATALGRARQSRYNARRSGNRPVGAENMSDDEVWP